MMKVGGDRLGALSAFEWLLAVAAFQVAAAEEALVAAATAGAAFCLAGSGTIAEPAIATGWRALRS